jgi:hypothetical protein
MEGTQEQNLFDHVAFSVEERLALLQEIGQVGLVLASANSASVCSLGADRPSTMPSPLERIALLEKTASLLSEALHAFDTYPPTQKTRQAQPTALARSKGGKEALSAITHTPQGAATWERGAGNLLEAYGVATLSGDILSAMTSLCDQVMMEVREFLPLAEFLGVSAIANRLSVVEREVQAIRHSPTLQGKSPFKYSAQRNRFSAGNVWRENTPATALLASAEEMYQSGLHWLVGVSTALLMAERAPWQLYEIWAYMKVVEALLKIGWRLEEGKGVRLVVRGLELELAHGRASALRFLPPTTSPHKERLTLWYQPYFPSANQRTGANSIVSLTHAMQPDIGLEWQGKWWLLDAKCKPYSAPQAEQGDTDKMHTYRDAIRCVGRQVVQEAWCLFPGTPCEVRAVLASPQSTPDAPFGMAGIGAILLRPNRLSLLYQWLQCTLPS